jgi:hypothetical protein
MMNSSSPRRGARRAGWVKPATEDILATVDSFLIATLNPPLPLHGGENCR